MEKLTDKNKEYLMANSPATLPLDAFNGGWSEQRIRDKFSVGFTIIFAWLKGIQEDGLTSDAALDKAINDNKAEYDAFKKVANEKFDALTEEDKALKKLIDDLEEKHDDEKRELDSKIDMVKETLENADDILEGKKLDKNNGTAINLKIQTMDTTKDAAVNVNYLEQELDRAKTETSRQHIKDFTRSYNPSTGVITINLVFNDNTTKSIDIDTPAEKILDYSKPPKMEGTNLVLTFVDGTSVRVDLSKFVDVYTGSTNEYAITTVENNVISVRLNKKWEDFLSEYETKNKAWETNEALREQRESNRESQEAQRELDLASALAKFKEDGDKAIEDVYETNYDTWFNSLQFATKSDIKALLEE